MQTISAVLIVICSFLGTHSFLSSTNSTHPLEGKWVVEGSPQYSLTFQANGDYIVDGNGDNNPEVTGNAVFEGNTVTFNDVSGDMACKNMPGKYNFNITDGVATFTVVEDACTGRKDFIVQSSLKKAE